MRELRQDQADALYLLREAVGRGARRIVMAAPTGFGKTVLAAAIVQHAREKRKRVLFTVPALSLIDQTIAMFNSQGIEEIGVIQAKHHMTDWAQPVQVASVQTLMKRELPKADVVLIDECHKLFTCYPKWFHPDSNPAWVGVPVIGLSATPWTHGLGAEGMYTELIVASTTQDLINQGLLSNYVVYGPSQPDLSGIKIVGGDYHEGQLSERMQEPKLVADIVSTWLKLAKGRPTLCYAVDRAHAKHLQRQFEEAGVRCGYQDAYTKDQERARIKTYFHAGEYEVVVNCETLTTGIDWDVRCISICRPTRSDMLFVQIVGRGLRVADGKDHCLILDHSDNHTRLGFVTDIDVSYTGLHPGKQAQHANRTAQIPLPKRCPQCNYLKAPRVSLCPQCGFKAQMQSDIEPEAGELRLLKREPKAPKEVADKGQFFAELKAYAQDRGFKPGWAWYKYRERLGVRPHQEIKDVAPALIISDDTRRWIKHTFIRHDRRLRNAESRY